MHIPVLLEESINSLNIKPGGIYADCTAGRCGHSELIAQKLFSPAEPLNEHKQHYSYDGHDDTVKSNSLSIPKGVGKLFCFDRDETAISYAESVFADYVSEGKISLVHSNFSEIKEELSIRGIKSLNGIFADLGVSSPQLDLPFRGFSYHNDGPLDMRMDMSESLTAREIVNSWEESELRNILYKFGEEKLAPRIAREIIHARANGEIKTTLELAETVKRAYPAKLRGGKHPARKTFQALRIAVNRETESLEKFLETAPFLLAPSGRLSIITFHSLEDRLVKQKFAELCRECVCPPEIPVCVCGRKQEFKLLSKKPAVPGECELEANLRSRSAKLRTVVKITDNKYRIKGV